MPNPVEGLLEVYEDMVEVLLVLEIFLTICSVLLLPAVKPACSSAMISACGLSADKKLAYTATVGTLLP